MRQCVHRLIRYSIETLITYSQQKLFVSICMQKEALKQKQDGKNVKEFISLDVYGKVINQVQSFDVIDELVRVFLISIR